MKLTLLQLIDSCMVEIEGEQLQSYNDDGDDDPNTGELELTYRDSDDNTYAVIVRKNSPTNLVDGKLTVLCRNDDDDYSTDSVELFFYTQKPFKN